MQGEGMITGNNNGLKAATLSGIDAGSKLVLWNEGNGRELSRKAVFSLVFLNCS